MTFQYFCTDSSHHTAHPLKLRTIQKVEWNPTLRDIQSKLQETKAKETSMVILPISTLITVKEDFDGDAYTKVQLQLTVPYRTFSHFSIG